MDPLMKGLILQQEVMIVYRLLALDIDGTLLTSEKRLSPKTLEGVQAAEAAGIQVVLCTGRSLQQSYDVLRQLGLTGPVITYNGAVTSELESSTVLDCMSFPVEDIAPFIHYCRKREIPFHLCTAFQLFVERIDDYQLQLFNDYHMEYSILSDVLTNSEPVVKFKVDDKQRIGGWQHIGTAQRKVVKDHRMDITHPHASKAAALDRLARSMGINRQEVAAIGDQYNDLSMIEYAGLGIAMGNAPWQLKQRANAETASNNEDGVYKAIVKHVLR